MRQRLVLAQTYNGHSNNPTDIRAAAYSGDFQEMELLNPGVPAVNLTHNHLPARQGRVFPARKHHALGESTVALSIDAAH